MFESPGRLHVHFSIPFYSGDQLIRNLRQIAGPLSRQGISIPDPADYRDVFSHKARGEDLGSFMPMEVERMSQVMGEGAELLVLSFSDLNGHPSRMFEGGVVHAGIEAKIEFLRQSFPNREMSLFFSAANPGSIMGAMLESGVISGEHAENLAARRPFWHEMLERIDAAHPDLPITLWANEDIPATWPVVLRESLGLPEGVQIAGGLHMAGALLSKPQRAALSQSLKDHPPAGERALVASLESFLAANVRADQLAFDVDQPGWTQGVIDDFADLYEMDLDCCMDIEQVRVITTESVLEQDMGADQEITQRNDLSLAAE